MCDTDLFLHAQIDRIEKDKWIQGQIQHSDPGEIYVIEWVFLNAQQFRDSWNASQCRTCTNCSACGHNVFDICSRYRGIKGN